MAILGVFRSNIVLMESITTITDFDVLCSLWLFTVDVLLMEEPGC